MSINRTRATGIVRVALDMTDMTGALCTGKAPLWDDHINGEPDWQREERWRQARQLCRRCPIRARCEATRGRSTGVWGGQVFATDAPPSLQPRPVPKPARGCPGCGVEFPTTGVSNNRRYCTPQCRDRTKARRLAARKPGYLPREIHLGPCAHCGAEIPAQRRERGSRTCSRRCKRQLDYERERAA